MRIVIVAVGLSVVASTAWAQDNAQNRAACMSDAMAYCVDYVPDQARIEACLRRNKANLSLPCQSVLAAAPVTPVADTGRRSRRSTN